MYKVLLIEDDKDIRKIIVKYFQKRDIQVIEAFDRYMGLSYMDSSINLILLDIMMPGIDGLEVFNIIRQQSSCPIIFISALSEEETQLKAFELGADDYISKPFLPSVLYAKCLAMCKRQLQVQTEMKIFHDLKIDYTNYQVWIQNKEIYLTYKEYLLTKNPDRLLEREQILNAIWRYGYYGNGRAVDTYIKKLRKKIEPCHYIQTIFKVGYMFKNGEKNEKTLEKDIV